MSMKSHLLIALTVWGLAAAGPDTESVALFRAQFVATDSDHQHQFCSDALQREYGRSASARL